MLRVGERATESRRMEKPFVCVTAKNSGFSTGQQSTLNTFRLCCDPPREQTMISPRVIFLSDPRNVHAPSGGVHSDRRGRGWKKSRGAAITFLMHMCIVIAVKKRASYIAIKLDYVSMDIYVLRHATPRVR